MSEPVWQRVTALPGRSDFSGLNQWLADNRVAHRFTLEGDSQILWVLQPELVEPAREAASQWLKTGQGVDGTIGVARHLKPTIQLNQPFAPATLVFLFLSFVGFALVSLSSNPTSGYASIFLYYDRVPAFTEFSDLWYNLREGQYWRILTPIFLHFGAIHIIFNALWLWFLGTRIETVFGSFALTVLVVVTGVVSNTAQALVSFPIPFGGMSGVVYALFSYLWLVGLVTKEPAFKLPPALFPVMVIFMLISWLGAFDWLAGGEVADTAHTVGFVSGLVCAAITLIFVRPNIKTEYAFEGPPLNKQGADQQKQEEQTEDEHR